MFQPNPLLLRFRLCLWCSVEPAASQLLPLTKQKHKLNRLFSTTSPTRFTYRNPLIFPRSVSFFLDRFRMICNNSSFQGTIRTIVDVCDIAVGGTYDLGAAKSNPLSRSHSVSVYPSENNVTRFSSGPLWRSATRSRPLSRSITKSGPISGTYVTSMQRRMGDHSSNLRGKHLRSKTKRLPPMGPFKGCMMGGDNTPVLQSCAPIIKGSPVPSGARSGILNGTSAEPALQSNTLHSNPIFFDFKCRRLNPPTPTLGGSALALHYANVIIVIEKLVASPHLIGSDARDDLYYMLPTSIRAALRARLKSYAKSLASSIYDTDLAHEWSEALSRILDWLGPLARNMIRWQSERTFEQQRMVSRTNVLLVQTLYFADLGKTEGAITELLVGLNYLWRVARVLDAKALMECASAGAYDEYLEAKG